VMSLCSSGPANVKLHALASVNDVDDDSIEYLPENFLLVHQSRMRRIPKGWDVRGEMSNLCSLFLLQQVRLIPKQALVFLLKQSFLYQLLFPLALKLSRYEPILWLYAVILASCSLGFVLGALQPLLPELVQLLALSFNGGSCFETQFERRRLQGLQSLLTHKRIQGCTRKTLATLVPVVRQHATAPVYVLPTVSPVSNAHPAIAFSAHEQPRQKGRTVFGGADFFGDRTVGFETFLVPLVLIPGNVSWQSISEKYHALLRWDHSAPGAGSARNLLASIHGSAPVG